MKYSDRVKKERVLKTKRLSYYEKELQRVDNLDKKNLTKRSLMFRNTHINSIKTKIKTLRHQLYNI